MKISSPSMPSAQQQKEAAERGGTRTGQILDKMNIETCLANRGRWPLLDPSGSLVSSSIPSSLLSTTQSDAKTATGRIVPLQEKCCSLPEAGQHEWPTRRSSRYEAFVRQTLADNQKRRSA